MRGSGVTLGTCEGDHELWSISFQSGRFVVAVVCGVVSNLSQHWNGGLKGESGCGQSWANSGSWG